MTIPVPFDSAETLPPIVLLVDDDRDLRDMYATYFEASGVWVAGAGDPDEALAAVDELKPDLVVTDIGFAGRASGIEFVHTLKTARGTAHVPVIVLTGRPAGQLPDDTRAVADLVLEKPVLPDLLLGRARGLIAASHALRRRSDIAVEKKEGADRRDVTMRPCPQCDAPLDWIERATIGSIEYDYYRSCLRGCGLYCFDRTAHTWVRLV